MSKRESLVVLRDPKEPVGVSDTPSAAGSRERDLMAALYRITNKANDEKRPDHDALGHDLAFSMTPGQSAYVSRLRAALRAIEAEAESAIQGRRVNVH